MSAEAPPRARRSPPSPQRAAKGPTNPTAAPPPRRRPNLRAVSSSLPRSGRSSGCDPQRPPQVPQPSARRTRFRDAPPGPRAKRPEAGGSGAHCRGCASQHEPGPSGAGNGGGGVSASQSLTSKGPVKRAPRHTRTCARSPLRPPPSICEATLAPRDRQSPPLANACQGSNRAAFFAPGQKLLTESRTGRREEVVDGDRRGKVGRERPRSCLLFSSLTGGICAPRPPPKQRINPPRKRWALPFLGGGGLRWRRRHGERAHPKFQVFMRPRFYNSRPHAERKSHQVPRSRENRPQLSACARPLRLQSLPPACLIF